MPAYRCGNPVVTQRNRAGLDGQWEPISASGRWMSQAASHPCICPSGQRQRHDEQRKRCEQEEIKELRKMTAFKARPNPFK
ncbi:GM19147 [Drosophila sechellia]|uniref:GM19147 n=1 Tax=Drosophila sechellia TaxID=7238 RepID=B4I9F5_DROSE|nr:GM19147 [Drosophila sechellia]